MEPKESKTKKEMTVKKEVAADEFERWALAWRIDTDTEDMDGEEVEEFEKMKRRFVRAITGGYAAINEDMSITYKLTEVVHGLESVTLKKPKGAAFLSMDRHKERQSIHKMNSFLGFMTGKDPKILSLMDGSDYQFCIGVVTLFLAS